MARVLLLCVIFGVAFGDVEFRSAWQGRWISFGDYYLSIHNCKENVCKLDVLKFEESIPSFSTKLRLLSYTKAEALNTDCSLVLKTTQRDTRSYETPSLVIETNTCEDKLGNIANYQQNKVYPAFDCKKAKTPNERTICDNADSSLAYFDIVLNDIYNELLKNLDSAKKSSLKQEQKSWLQSLESCKGALECMKNTYIERLIVLDSKYCAECEATNYE